MMLQITLIKRSVSYVQLELYSLISNITRLKLTPHTISLTVRGHGVHFDLDVLPRTTLQQSFIPQQL